jgi:tetratricopeptide (TPR) repeat protein
MKIDDQQLAITARRLREAIGFMELGLPEYSLDRLDGLDAVGPFAAQIELVRGEALRKLHRFGDAAASLKRAVAKFPAPYNKQAVLALSACYQQAGDHVGAANALASARGAGIPSSHKPSGGGPA